VRTDEILFRVTAHGLLAWALATIIVVALLIVGSAVAGAVGSDPCASRSGFTRSCRGGSNGSDQLLFL
jgi:hypothetical protein